MFAQIGLGDPSGGALVLLVIGLLAIAGLIAVVFGAVLLARSGKSRGKAVVILFVGLILASPALWFAYEFLVPDIPRDKSWDLSSSQSVAQLHEERVQEEYYYQGHIRSTIKLPANRQWSGDAGLVLFRASAGRVAEIRWKSRPADAARVYEDAGRILQGLGLPRADLDAWYVRVRRGEQASFSTVARSDTEPSVELLVLGAVGADWLIHVNVWLNQEKAAK